MIATLNGKLVGVGESWIIIEVNGIGYQVFVTGSVLRDLPLVGETMLVYTHMQVRDDTIILYGFSSEDEKLLYQQIVSVSGIGPKTAVSILSAVTPLEFVRAIQERQISQLTQLPGIGKKSAERLVLELHDKLKTISWDTAQEEEFPITSDGNLDDAVAALTALGYSHHEAEKMVQAASATIGNTYDLQDLLKAALANKLTQKG